MRHLSKITESNIKRMLDSAYEDGYIVISACRGSLDLMGKEEDKLTDKEFEQFIKMNNERTNKLRKIINSEKLTYYEVDGGYFEETGEEVSEKSFFILNYNYQIKDSIPWEEFQEFGMAMCDEFNQDSFLFFDPKCTEEDKPCYFDRYGKKCSNSFTGIIYNDLTQTYFTVYKNNRFTLKSLKRMQVGGGMMGMLPTNDMYRGGIYNQ